MSRYNGRDKAINKAEMYEKLLKQRGTQKILQYTTAQLKFPNEEEFNAIRTTEYVWKMGDKFWKIAYDHYGDTQLWWLIAQFNRKPTEGHMSPGDVLKIPIDLSVILGALS